jgi:predicted amidophosphoribosyltransferase
MIFYVCAWCGKELRQIPHERDLISHGLCASCADDVRVEAARSCTCLEAVEVHPREAERMLHMLHA